MLKNTFIIINEHFFHYLYNPYNERELLEIEKLKLQTYKLRKQIGELEGSLVPIKRLEELEADRRMDVFEIFREHMIDRLYLDLAEETSDLKIYGKLLQACKAATEELFPADRVNELHKNLNERSVVLP